MSHPRVEFFAESSAPAELLSAVRSTLGPVAQVRWLIRLPAGCKASEYLALNLRDAASGLYPGCTVARVTVGRQHVWAGLAARGKPAESRRPGTPTLGLASAV